MKAVVLYAYPPGLELRPAVERHLRALERLGDEIVFQNALAGRIRPPRSQPDAVVLHTTFLCLRWFEDFERHRSRFAWLSRLDCPKLALPQDEYDHSEVLDEWLREIGVTSVYSNFDEAVREPVYPLLAGKAAFREALTGYVDEDVLGLLRARTQPLRERPFDVVYRATQLPYWFGSHGQLKHRIGVAVAERSQALGLATDISTRPEDTILGEGWWNFLGSGRVVIGSESGSSVLDRRGEMQGRIRRLLALEPSLSFEELSARMPEGWDSWAFFALSPRHLEAVMTKTAQVLVEGSYSGVLQPERHYIPLRRDLANLDEALDRIRDLGLLEQLTEQAYEDVVASGAHTYTRFAARLQEDVGPTRRAASPVVGRRLDEGRTRLAGAPVARSRSVVANAFRAAGVLARSQAARQLLKEAIRKRQGSPTALVKELVQFHDLRKAAGPGGATISVGPSPETPTILISTGPGDQVPRATQAEFLEAVERGAAVVWLHGSGAAGPRRFHQLSALAGRQPGEVARLLDDLRR